jgi:hypothetical protein
VSSTDRHARRPARHRRLDGDGGPGHGHGHGHSPAPPADRRVRVLIAALLVPCALATVVGLVVLYPFGEPAPADDVTTARVDGHVTTATETA